MSLPPKPIITPIAPPKACAKLTPAQTLSGPPMPPEKRIQAYSNEEFEEFIEDWAFYYLLGKSGKYEQIARMGGAGDKGRDVVAYIDPVSSGGRLDIYQCKHYDSPLNFSDIAVELAKLCYFTHSGAFRVPEEYRFVAPRNVGPSLGFLFEKPNDLKEKLIETWTAKPFEKIVAGVKIELQGSLKTYVENFDFLIIGYKSIQETISEFKQTSRYPQRFGGGLIKPCPVSQTLPDNIEDHEQRYVEQLVDAYRDDCKKQDLCHEELDKPYKAHFQRARENYFCAETLKAYEKDNKIEGYSFDELQQDILAGIIDVAESEHDSGFHRVKETTKAAVDMTFAEHPLNQFVQTRTKHGQGQISWRFWERYKTYLDQKVKLPITVVNNLDTETNKVLSRLENPKREGSWDRRGLVVGSVQSGKTGNYTGLVCKAIDAGYKLVIVLAGMHNSLRSQTQIRTDEGVIGFDTSRSQFYGQGNHQWVGVGQIFGPRLPIDSLTTSAEKGDFKKAQGSTHTVSLGGNPYILVIKKNVSILKNVLEWALERNGYEVEEEDNRGVALREGELPRVIADVPFLLIDDEADIASINTKAVAGDDNPDDYDRPAINREIVRMLRAFDKSAFVGYTATPYANIYINPNDVNDVFPRSFIFNLEQPDNYVGAAKVFGLPDDPEAGIEGRDPLPLVIEVTDQKVAFPDKYKKEHDPRFLPESLKEAMDAFVLVCAARRARGQIKVHNSMLIHVARFVAVQNKVKKLVEIELRATQHGIRYNDEATLSRLEELWKAEFEPKTYQMVFNGQIKEAECLPLSWNELKAHLHDAAAKIAVKEINGEAQDILDYVQNKENGRSVIAVGGDKLSRGLTLEGLSVSYYLRATTMYDTLMQMGRWFGYRDGYLDLCRLYTTPQLKMFYEWITMADRELRNEFDAMSFAGRTPKEYGLRVRSHPGGLIVTALNKSKFSTKMQVTFTGELVQTSYLDKTKEIIEANFERAEKFIAGLNTPLAKVKGKTTDKGTRLWKDVPADKVARFLKGFVVNQGAITAQGDRLAEYIEAQQNANGDLSRWSVALISPASAKARLQMFGGQPNVGKPIRVPQPIIVNGKPVMPFREQNEEVYCLRQRNVITPSDSWIDLEGEVLIDASIEALLRKECFGGKNEEEKIRAEVERDIIQKHKGKLVTDLGMALTKHRANLKKPGGGNTIKEISGRVMRELRLQSNGLLLLYPLDPTGGTDENGEIRLQSIAPEVKAIIGFAVSFPVAENAVPIEYQVNEVFRANQNDSLWSEADFEEDELEKFGLEWMRQ